MLIPLPQAGSGPYLSTSSLLSQCYLIAYYSETIVVEPGDASTRLYPCRLPNSYIIWPLMANAVDKRVVFLNPRKIDGLAKMNLKIYMGPERAGLQQLLRRGGGYIRVRGLGGILPLFCRRRRQAN